MTTDEPILRWVRTRIGGNIGQDPTDGTLKDGKMSVARIGQEEAGLYPGSWRWNLFVTGAIVPLTSVVEARGMRWSKEEAKADAEAAYRKLLGLHPENREALLAHWRSVRRSMWFFASGEGRRRTQQGGRS